MHILCVGLLCASSIFHRQVWYRAFSLRYAHIRCSGIMLISWATFVPNFVSVTASIAELAHGEKSRTHSLSHSPSLFDSPGTEAFV